MRTIEDIKKWIETKQDEAIAAKTVLSMKIPDEKTFTLAMAGLKGTMAMLISLENYITQGELDGEAEVSNNIREEGGEVPTPTVQDDEGS